MSNTREPKEWTQYRDMAAKQRAAGWAINDELKAQIAQEEHYERLRADGRRESAEREARQDAERKAKAEADLELRFASRKVVERNAWLAAHPEFDAGVFEAKAWPLLKANLAAEGQADDRRLAKEALRRSGNYAS